MTEGETEIHRLDQSTIERIAAGEVVERPASVVKELVENSLDADASRVRVAVERGGKDGIRVTDDGTGMSESAVRTAVEKHTTSKISDIADLEAGVSSLGFRGEALAAIGAVSRLTVRTKSRGTNRGTELRMAGGEIESIEPAGCPEGTTVEISDLFYNVPARRKFLKQDATEFSHANRVATGYALSNPELALSLSHDDHEVFSTTGQGSLEATVLSVYGREVAKAMIPVEDERETSPLDGLEGVVSHPETTRASSEHCSVFVNGRYVSAGAVRNAVVEAYGTQLAPDRYPFTVLFLSLPANAVDVNVHPRKKEVRFADEAEVSEQVRTAVENALMREGLVRSGAPRGQSAPEQTAIEPDRTKSADSESTAVDSSSESTTAPRTAHTEVDTPDEPRRNTVGAESPVDAEVSTEAAEPTTENENNQLSATNPVANRLEGDENGREREIETGRKFTEAVEQTTLDGESVIDNPEFDRLPSLRVLGQLHDTYVVCESPDGLVLIDQHAADERINYERLRERVAGETGIQRLTEPVELELTAGEGALFSTFAEALSELGFRATQTDERTVEVRAVPVVLAGAADPELLCDALVAFVGDGNPSDTVEKTTDALLSDLACYPSITGNTSLSEGTVVELLRALDACENPYACPHGRPVVIELSETELEDRFERDYPGHAGRRTDDATSDAH